MDGKRTSKVIFQQDNVVVYTPGPLKGENAFTGKLLIVQEAHGYVLEWHSVQPVDVSQSSSPDCESLDWEDVSSAVVGYKADHENGKDSVEIKSTVKPPKLVTFELADLKSFRAENRKPADCSEIVATFFLRDGSTIHSLHFESEPAFSQFLQSLKICVSLRRSHKDDSLFLVIDEKPMKKQLEKSFNDLELFDERGTHLVTKLFKDPYNTAMGGFSKVTSFVIDSLLYPNGTGSPSEYQEERIVEMLNESLPRVDIDHHEEPGYELITCIQMPERPTVHREEQISYDEWQSYVDSEGRIKDVEKLKRRIFKGGLMHSVRSQAWKFLLKYYSFDSTTKERELRRKQKVDDYYRMKLQWKSIDSIQESRFAALRERRSLIDKDVSRTDRTHPFFEGDSNINIQMLYDILMTYCMYNFDLGYVQGMSDLLSPILVVMQNEADSFWCFSEWMEQIGVNFEMDQQGMKTQLQSLHRLLHFVDTQFCSYLENHESGNLYFAFRWLLILFKRDFKFQDILRLWEVLWTELPCKNFHLLISLAILDTEKSTIMENNYGLTEILKHINDMAYKINLEDALCKAEAIYEQIIRCSHLSDVVQNILGIEEPLQKGKLEAAAPTKMSDQQDLNHSTECQRVPSTSANVELEDEEITVMSRIHNRNINEFIDLGDDTPYGYPFDLYTT